MANVAKQRSCRVLGISLSASPAQAALALPFRHFMTIRGAFNCTCRNLHQATGNYVVAAGMRYLSAAAYLRVCARCPIKVLMLHELVEHVLKSFSVQCRLSCRQVLHCEVFV